MINDKLLIDKILAGTPNAFPTLIRQYQRLVCHIVFRMVPNDLDREDVCQNVFIKVYKNLAKFQFESKVSTWIAKIAYNTCLNHLKKKAVPLFDDLTAPDESIDNCVPDLYSPADYAAKKDLSSKLQAEIEKLPLQFRTILTLYHLDEMRYAEITEILGLPEGTVKSYLFRARKMLKERLMSQYQQEDLCY
ncbi:MAG: RNA polymerase sigma factor [bacterium]